MAEIGDPEEGRRGGKPQPGSESPVALADEALGESRKKEHGDNAESDPHRFLSRQYEVFFSCTPAGAQNGHAQHQSRAATQNDGSQFGDTMRENPAPHFGRNAMLVMDPDEGAEHGAIQNDEKNCRHSTEYSGCEGEKAYAGVVSEQHSGKGKLFIVAHCAPAAQDGFELVRGGSGQAAFDFGHNPVCDAVVVRSGEKGCESAQKK